MNSSLDEFDSLDQEAESDQVYTIIAKGCNEIGNITRKLYTQSKLLIIMLSLDRDLTRFELLDYKFNTLQRIVCYMKYHADKPAKPIDKPIKSSNMSELVDKFDADFIDLPDEDLCELTKAADHMQIDPLIDLCCAKIATYINGKTADQLREYFGLEDDLTAEEKAQLRRENM